MITLITVCYNSAERIERCIFSVLEQDFPDLEHIFIDGGSTDNTVRIIKKHCPNALIISESDFGIYDALNKGLRLANGNLVGVLHTDDSLATGKVLSAVYKCYTETQCNVVYTDINYVREVENGLKVVRSWQAGLFDIDKLNNGWMPPHTGLFVENSFLKHIGEYNLTYKIASDFEYIQRLFRDDDIRVVYLPIVSVQMLIGGQSNNPKNMVMKSREDYKILNKFVANPLLALIMKNVSKLSQFRF